MRICWGHSTVCFIYSFMIQVISQKAIVAKVFLAIWEILLHGNNHNYSSYRFSYKFAFTLCLPLLTNHKQGSGFLQVGGLVRRNISAFSLWWVEFYFKTMLNSINPCEGIFLHVIPVCIIVPWSQVSWELTLHESLSLHIRCKKIRFRKQKFH